MWRARVWADKPAWNTPGTYLVKVRARDEHLAYSSWSSGLTVTVTATDNDPLISNPNPPNGSVDVPITKSTLSVDIKNADGGAFNYVISSIPNIDFMISFTFSSIILLIII